MDWKKLLLLPLAMAMISGSIIAWYWAGVLLSRYISRNTDREKVTDYAGTLSIEGCLVSDVVQGKDNSYYLTHAADQSESKYGCPFIDAGWTPDAQNLVIYGHNSLNGTGFSDLVKYRDFDFAQSHPLIHFTDRDDAEHAYGLVMVLDYSTDYIRTHNPFSLTLPADYLQRMEPFALFTSSAELQDVNKYAVSANKTSENVDNEAIYVDKYITLSTCDAATYGSKGRLVIVGKELPRD